MQETEYFGPRLGWLPVHESSWAEFNQNCAASRSKANDCTGQRVYAGAHVACRFIEKYHELIDGLSVLELGCGTGIVGIVGQLAGRPLRVVYTDGVEATLQIAARNIEQLLVGKTDDSHIFRLEWDVAEHIDEAKTRFNGGRPFDAVLGCELMYYRTDVQQLCRTMLRLCDRQGLFIHSHLFRRPGQEQELEAFLEDHGWATLEVPVGDFVTGSELAQRADWYNVRTLVSGPSARLRTLQELHPQWLRFRPTAPEEPFESELLGRVFA